MQQSFKEAWNELRTTVDDAAVGLVADCVGQVKQLDELRRDLETVFRDTSPQHTPGRVQSLRDLYDLSSQPLLFEPLARRREIAAQRRAIVAIDAYLRTISDLAVRLPIEIRAGNREIADVLGHLAIVPRARNLLQRTDDPRPVAFRAPVVRLLSRRRRKFLRCAGELLLRIAALEEALVDPWEAVQAESLRQLDGAGADPREFEHDRQLWFRSTSRLSEQASAALGRLRKHVFLTPQVLARDLAKARKPKSVNRSKHTHPSHGERLWAETLEFWTRRRNGIDVQLDLSSVVASLGSRLAGLNEAAVHGVDEEREQLMQELELVASRLRDWDGELDSAFFVPAATVVRSAASRFDEWGEVARTEASRLLADDLEVASAQGILSSWRSPWKLVRPLESFLNGLEVGANPSEPVGFEAAEKEHRKVVRDIDKARQVVIYGVEAASQEGEPKLAREAVHNSLELIERRRNEAIDSHGKVESAVTEWSAAALARCAAVVAEDRFGLLKRLARQRLSRVVATGGSKLIRILRTGLKTAWMGLRRLHRWTLVGIGWERQPEIGARPVEKRPAGTKPYLITGPRSCR